MAGNVPHSPHLEDHCQIIVCAGDLPTLCPWGRGLRCLCWLGRPFAWSATCPTMSHRTGVKIYQSKFAVLNNIQRTIYSPISMKYRRHHCFVIKIANHMYFFVLRALTLAHRERGGVSCWRATGMASISVVNKFCCKYPEPKGWRHEDFFVLARGFGLKMVVEGVADASHQSIVEGVYCLRYLCCPVDCKATRWCAQIHCVRAKFKDLCWFGGG